MRRGRTLPKFTKQKRAPPLFFRSFFHCKRTRGVRKRSRILIRPHNKNHHLCIISNKISANEMEKNILFCNNCSISSPLPLYKPVTKHAPYLKLLGTRNYIELSDDLCQLLKLRLDSLTSNEACCSTVIGRLHIKKKPAEWPSHCC